MLAYSVKSLIIPRRPVDFSQSSISLCLQLHSVTEFSLLFGCTHFCLFLCFSHEARLWLWSWCKGWKDLVCQPRCLPGVNALIKSIDFDLLFCLVTLFRLQTDLQFSDLPFGKDKLLFSMIQRGEKGKLLLKWECWDQSDKEECTEKYSGTGKWRKSTLRSRDTFFPPLPPCQYNIFPKSCC